jgi:hypothetical protein
MESNFEKHEHEPRESSPSTRGRWVVVAIFTSFLTTVVAMGYGLHQQSVVSQLTSRNQEMASAMNDMHSQMDTLGAKLNDVSSQAATAVAALQQQSATTQSGGKGASAKQRAASSRQLKQLQATLTDQQKQLKDTQDQIAKDRTDLEGALSSTKDELNGSIATTHEELVALQKRGERNYFEFDITKSKSFQREGPLSLSLRKADAKHKNYDIAMVVDDDQLMKKKINLYEPVWIHRIDDPQPVQIVVNKIGKDTIHGYVSAPKYRNSELTPAAKNVSDKQVSPDSSATQGEMPDRPE